MFKAVLRCSLPFLLAAVVLHAQTPQAPVRITILGDSIDADEPSERPIQGWGTFLQEKLVGAQVTNLALSGRSTKTFLHGETNKAGGHNEPKNWIKAQATPADYWIIKFGGNDSHPAEEEKHTDADTEYAANLKLMIDTARKLGITPILVSPPDRPAWDGQPIPETGPYAITPYANAARRVALAEKVPLIDMYAYSHAWYASIGPKGIEEYVPLQLGGHLSLAGAQLIAQWMAEQVVKIVPQLKLAPLSGGSAVKPGA